MSFLKATVILGAIVATSAWFGCSAADDGETGDDANITGSTQCNVFDNQTGQQLAADKLAKLNDPIANKLLAGDTCPKTYTAALAKLKTNDNKDCTATDGLGSFLVSETAAFVSADQAASAGYRTVIAKDCEKRGQDSMLFSAFANAGQVADTSIEMIGKDATTGVFNYYEVLGGGQWVFYGTSEDFIGNGYTCKDSGFCVSNNSKKASSPSRKSCASCHISGALIMKELDSPWLHWTSGHANGSEKVVANAKGKLGTQQAGENLEFQVVRKSFDGYSKKRVDILAKRGAAELLRPLFCTMDINLNSGLGGTNLVTDPALASSFLTVDQNEYNNLKKEIGQNITGVSGKDDTAFPFTFPTKGQSDTAYMNALKNAKLIDDEFAKDILAVDMTRPIFSGQRCALVSVIKDKTAAVDAKLKTYADAKTQPEKDAAAPGIAKDLVQVFKDALNARGSRKPAEDQFLTFLNDAGQNVAAHQTAANAFFKACNDRLAADKKGALKDILTYAAHVRRVMRSDVVGFNGQDLLEGGGDDDKMVHDNLPDNPNALNPKTCALDLSQSAVQ